MDLDDDLNEALDILLEMIQHDSLTIELIDNKNPKTRALLYNKLRFLFELHFSEKIDAVKFAGREELDLIEEKLEKEKKNDKLRLLKIIRTIFYC